VRFLVTGCSRSGTTYAARLFGALGIPCGHESVFNIFRVRPGDPAPELDHPKWEGDASFLAVPFLETLPAGTVVLHQTRHPLEVIRSHMGIRFFADPVEPSPYLADNHADFLRVIERRCPEIFRERDECARSALYWVHWNRLAGRAARVPGLDYVRYRLEDLDAGLLRRLVARIGVEVPDERVEAALAAVPRDANHRPRDESITLSRIPAGPVRDALLHAARDHGYSTNPWRRSTVTATSA
jgi:hypothetical protein